MIDVRIALNALLLSDPAVNAAVGGTRIYPAILQQGQRLPSIVYNRISGVFPFELDGSAGIIQNLMQIDSVAASHTDASNLANLVHDALTGFKGQVGNCLFQGIFPTNERDLYDSVALLHRVSRDYATWFKEVAVV